MKDFSHQSVPSMLLAEDHVHFGGMNLFYRLRVIGGDVQNRFSISISMLNESAEEEVGNDIENALRIYRRMIDGAVTPCALSDVISDLRYESKKVKKSLYNPFII